MITQLLFLAGAVATIIAVTILVILAPKPSTTLDHVLGLGRVLVIAGAAFSAASLFLGWRPSWPVTLLMLGVGLKLALYARGHNLDVIRDEAGGSGGGVT